ncbi:MAG: GNAT family N-acetyltransferase [Candidatus Zhuqueibacterota bacterium]
MEFLPLTQDSWDSFETLFGQRGASGGCWCMWWRLSNRQFQGQKGEANRLAMKAIVAEGRIPGILAVENGQAVGWCAVAPREEFPRLNNSRILRPVDDSPVWSVVCLFVDKKFRRRGISTALLKAAVAYVQMRGGRTVEGYAIDPKAGKMPDVFVYNGLYSAYISAGFVEVARRSATRPIMRFVIGKDDDATVSTVP